jgi:hypothetical protein
LSTRDIAVLDAFEGEQYQRQMASVVMDDHELTTWVYILREAFHGQLIHQEWDLKKFLDTEYASFMKRFVQARRHIYDIRHGL